MRCDSYSSYGVTLSSIELATVGWILALVVTGWGKCLVDQRVSWHLRSSNGQIQHWIRG